MTEDRRSKLQLYSIGIVVEDKKDGSDDILVFPVEELPQIDGPIADHAPDYKVAMPNAGGVQQTAEIKGSATLTAKWLPYGQSNRITAPDVIKNETVALFRYADTDEYYWTTIFREPSIRRLETVCYMYGNLKTPLKQWDKATSYWVEVSTKLKYIKLHTSKSDGEPFGYDVTIDPKNGFVEIKDDRGNLIKLDSEATILTLENAEKSNVVLEKDKIHSKAADSISSETKTTNQTSSDVHTVTAKSFVVKASGATMTLTSGGDVAIETASNVLLTAPTVTINGNLKVNGDADFSGNLKLGGKGTAQSWTP